MSDEIKGLSEQSCAGLFPSYYDGVLEAERISQIDDAIIENFVAAILRLFRNAYIQTADADVVAEFEKEFDLSATSTIEERRQNIIEFINRLRVIGDETILEAAKEAAETDDIEVTTNAITMICQIEPTQENVTFEQLFKAVKNLLPIIPQAILLQAVKRIEKTLSLQVFGGCMTVDCVSLGVASEPPDPEANAEIYILGSAAVAEAVLLPSVDAPQTVIYEEV